MTLVLLYGNLLAEVSKAPPLATVAVYLPGNPQPLDQVILHPEPTTTSYTRDSLYHFRLMLSNLIPVEHIQTSYEAILLVLTMDPPPPPAE